MSLHAVQTIPIFRIFDRTKAHEFYLDFLGFTLDWEHRFDDKAPRYTGSPTIFGTSTKRDAAVGGWQVIYYIFLL